MSSCAHVHGIAAQLEIVKREVPSALSRSPLSRHGIGAEISESLRVMRGLASLDLFTSTSHRIAAGSARLLRTLSLLDEIAPATVIGYTETAASAVGCTCRICEHIS
jgi:hypothetical protein